MPRLMGGNANGRHRGGVVHGVRKPDDVFARVVVVGQLAGDVLKAHVGDAVGKQDALGGLAPGQAAQAADLAVFCKGGLHLCLGKKRQ